jgi:hypothetical protein
MPRPLGSLNKTTKEIKEAFSMLLVSKIDKLSVWIDKLAEEDPAEAARLMLRMSAMFVPSANKMIDFQIANPTHPVFLDGQEIEKKTPEKSARSNPAMDFLHDERVLSRVLTAMRDPKVPVEEALPIAEFLKDTHPHIHRQAMEIIDDKRFSAALEKSGDTPPLPLYSPAPSQSSPASSALSHSPSALRLNRAQRRQLQREMAKQMVV